MSRAVIAVAALTLAGITGCGTTMNIAEPNPLGGDPHRKPAEITVYGGVVNDVRFAKTAAGHDGVAPKLLAAAAVLDMPFSAIADTLTLPLTVAATTARAIRDYRAPREPRPLTEEERQQLRDVPPGHLTPERIHGPILE
jgi:uncharacterized protein YceK